MRSRAYRADESAGHVGLARLQTTRADWLARAACRGIGAPTGGRERLYRFKFGLPVRVSIVNIEPSSCALGARQTRNPVIFEAIVQALHAEEHVRSREAWDERGNDDRE